MTDRDRNDTTEPSRATESAQDHDVRGVLAVSALTVIVAAPPDGYRGVRVCLIPLVPAIGQDARARR